MPLAGTDDEVVDPVSVDVSDRHAGRSVEIGERRDGRYQTIAVAVEDLHLPLQALDYWMRVAWHLQRDELRHLFPVSVLQNKPPKLFVIAPAMAFHSSNADILRYFAPEIEVERIGLNSDWRNNLRIVLRLKGADLPISHGSSSASGGGGV